MTKQPKSHDKTIKMCFWVFHHRKKIEETMTFFDKTMTPRGHRIRASGAKLITI